MNKKFFKYVFMLMVILMGAVAFSACGGSDNEGTSTSNGSTLGTASHASDAMRLTISDTSSPYSQIEFTESGTYILTPQTTSGAKKTSFIELEPTVTSKASTSSIIYGKYTKSGDTYTLEGFGTITVTKNSDGTAADLVITTGSTSYNFSAKIAINVGSSTKTAALCRTWGFKSVTCTVTVDGQQTVNKTGTWEEVSTAMGEKISSKYPSEVIFTSAGTYVVKYTDNTLAVSTWKWKDEAAGLMYYGWDYGHFDEEAVITVSFSGNDVIIEESHTEAISSGGTTHTTTEYQKYVMYTTDTGA